MGLAEWFSGFCSNLTVQSTSSISTRYKNITKRLNTDFWSTTSDTSHSLYVGSYGRNTAINGFSDLDMIFQLPATLYTTYDNYSGNGQSALLQAVKKSIEKTYSTTSIRADGQVIVVPFTDGISFEVVPAFINTANSFTYPDANNGGRWRTTNPKPEIAAIKERNAACNNNLIRLCRMMRAWKRKWDVPIAVYWLIRLPTNLSPIGVIGTNLFFAMILCVVTSLSGWPTRVPPKSSGKHQGAVNTFTEKACFSTKLGVATISQ